MLKNRCRGTIYKVGLIRTQGERIAPQFDIGVVMTESDYDLVLQTHGLHEGPNIVKSVESAVENSEDEIDLRRGENRDRRGWRGG
jgi:hypothetical protein